MAFKRDAALAPVLAISSCLLVLSAARAFSEEPGPLVSEKLQRFLTAEDLDEISEARDEVKPVTAQDQAAIRRILKDWRNGQPVANLLCFSDLIPEDIRLATLRRGLAEREVPYFVVAAIYGLSSVDSNKLTSEDRKQITSELLRIIRANSDVRAWKAALKLKEFATIEDAPRVMWLMEHCEKDVQRCLRIWLMNTFEGKTEAEYSAAASKSELPEAARRRLVQEITAFLVKPDTESKKQELRYLIPYTPNFNEYKPANSANRDNK
jgi:hypothetical protein